MRWQTFFWSQACAEFVLIVCQASWTAKARYQLTFGRGGEVRLFVGSMGRRMVGAKNASLLVSYLP